MAQPTVTKADGERPFAVITGVSVAWFLPIPYMAVYAATKVVLIAFTQSLAEAVGPCAIRVQACCPGSTATEFDQHAGSKLHDPGGLQSPLEVVRVSLSRLGTGPVVVPPSLTSHVLRIGHFLLPDRLWARLAGWWIHRPLPDRSIREQPSI